MLVSVFIRSRAASLPQRTPALVLGSEVLKMTPMGLSFSVSLNSLMISAERVGL